jgi:hypothetical protein
LSKAPEIVSGAFFLVKLMKNFGKLNIYTLNIQGIRMYPPHLAGEVTSGAGEPSGAK